MKKLARKYLPDRLKSILRKFYYRYPVLRKIYYFPLDLINLIFGKKKLVPPRSKVFVGDGNFEAISQEFFGYFINLIKLKPEESVLEVGSGIGRMAIPLTGYLNNQGSYDGLEIVKDGVAWCEKNISKQFPNFKFQLIDVYNELYNMKGRYKASEYKFPFTDKRFDFIFLTSVFTHMVLKDIKNYLAEISRVLKPGGRLLATFFLLNPEAGIYVDSPRSRFKFHYQQSRVIDKNIPEASIAHEENIIRDIYSENGLLINEPIHFGSWCQREKFLSSQDIIISTKI